METLSVVRTTHTSYQNFHQELDPPRAVDLQTTASVELTQSEVTQTDKTNDEATVGIDIIIIIIIIIIVFVKAGYIYLADFLKTNLAKFAAI